MVRVPTATDGRSQAAGFIIVSTVRVSRFEPAAEYAVRLDNCPRMMLMATALTKPTTTDCGTKRTSVPSRSSPTTSITRPVRTASVKRARDASGPSCTWGTSAMSTAIAPVACTDMNTELVARAPVTVPTR